MINKLYKFDFLDEDFCALEFEVYIFEVFLEGIGKSSIERYLNFEFWGYFKGDSLPDGLFRVIFYEWFFQTEDNISVELGWVYHW